MFSNPLKIGDLVRVVKIIETGGDRYLGKIGRVVQKKPWEVFSIEVRVEGDDLMWFNSKELEVLSLANLVQEAQYEYPGDK
jgi:hypothetical protein